MSDSVECEVARADSAECVIARTDDEITREKAKLLGARGSVSSVDSSISLSYDAAPFTPRSSLVLTTDDESSIRSRFAESSSSSNESGKAKPIDEDEPFDPPDAELTQRIIDQVEYYFSDENIVKDAFLLKHVRRNKEGFVSLKLIASFKRVKHLARDWRVVRAALEQSNKLEINEVGTKLRRTDPLPLYDQTTPSRTVVAIDIPQEKANIESVAEMFRSCGEIALIRILRPGNPIPADVRPFYNKHPEMHNTVSALIEFVRTESAHNALNKDSENKENTIQVLELNATLKKKVQTSKRYPHRVLDSEFSSSCQSGSEDDMRYRLRMQRRCSSPHLQHRPQEQNMWNQRRWSRDSGSESPGSVRSRSNSGVYIVPEQRRMSSGCESGSEYSSCRSRSSSGASIPDIFAMRRYSVPRKEPTCCCCGYPKCETTNNTRRFSLGRSDNECANRTLSRCNSSESESAFRRDSVPEYYPLHRGNTTPERRPSLTKDGAWSRNNSISERGPSEGECSGLIRRRSFGSGSLPTDNMLVRLPRGPDINGRGFQRELIEYALPE